MWQPEVSLVILAFRILQNSLVDSSIFLSADPSNNPGYFILLTLMHSSLFHLFYAPHPSPTYPFRRHAKKSKSVVDQFDVNNLCLTLTGIHA